MQLQHVSRDPCDRLHGAGQAASVDQTAKLHVGLTCNGPISSGHLTAIHM